MSSDKQFVNQFEKKVASTIKKFKLIKPEEKVLVAVSGGKDSTTALYVLKKLGYNTEAITIDAAIGNYTKQNLENIKKFCKSLGVKLHIVSFKHEFGKSLSNIKSVLTSKGVRLNTCAVCGVLRRYLLNKHARKIGAKKIATGHNLDDEAQAIMMNIFRSTPELSSRLGPKTGIAESKKFVPRIKPLYFCSEAETTRYSKIQGFPVKYERCPYSEDAYRNSVRNFLNALEQKNPKLKQNIVSYFLKKLPALKQKFSLAQKMLVCSKCGEPTSHKICNTCRIVEKIR